MPAPQPLARVIDATLEATVVGSFSRVGSVLRSRMDGWSTDQRLEGDGQRVVVTGANTGIGYAVARRLLRAGAQVHLLVRSEEKAARTVASLEREVGSGAGAAVTTGIADLLDLASVRDAAGRLAHDGRPVTGLVHNAGAMFPERGETVDGLERTYQLHVVAPFLLTAMVRPLLRANAPARVLTVTSGGMYTTAATASDVDSPDGYRPAVAYARAKRAQVTLLGAWQEHSEGQGIAFHAAHPGWVLTDGVATSLPRFRVIAGPVLRDTDEGSDTIAWLALGAAHTQRPVPPPDGRLWHDRRPRSAHRLPWTRPTPGERQQLWDRVCNDAGLTPELQLREG